MVKQQKKSTLLDKPRKFLKNRFSNDLSVETTRYSKCNWEKSGMKFIELTTKVSTIPNFLFFDNTVSILDPFRKFTSIRNTTGSGWKRVVTGTVSKRYPTSFFAQLSKTVLESVNFDLICPIFSIQILRKIFPATSWVRMV